MSEALNEDPISEVPEQAPRGVHFLVRWRHFRTSAPQSGSWTQRSRRGGEGTLDCATRLASANLGSKGNGLLGRSFRR
jgi:hypothetical protein